MTRNEALEYYKQERDRFEKTRGIQWKFGISLWTLIALAITFFGKNYIKLDKLSACLLCFLFLCAHFVFALFVQKGLVAARTRCNNILTALNTSKEEFVFPDTSRPPPSLTENDKWWIFFQVLATNVLLLVLLSTMLNK